MRFCDGDEICVLYGVSKCEVWIDLRIDENALRQCGFLHLVGMSNRKGWRWDRLSVANVPGHHENLLCI
jgi:hypothetical protein